MNKREQMAYEKYVLQGYDVIKAGKPDLILLKDGEIKFVEIKSKIGAVSGSQDRAITLLKKHGFDVKVERIELEANTELIDPNQELVLIDNGRRLTLPKKFTEALGLTEDQLKEKYPFHVEAYPSLEDCKTVILKKR